MLDLILHRGHGISAIHIYAPGRASVFRLEISQIGNSHTLLEIMRENKNSLIAGNKVSDHAPWYHSLMGNLCVRANDFALL